MEELKEKFIKLLNEMPYKEDINFSSGSSLIDSTTTVISREYEERDEGTYHDAIDRKLHLITSLTGLLGSIGAEVVTQWGIELNNNEFKIER